MMAVRITFTILAVLGLLYWAWDSASSASGHHSDATPSGEHSSHEDVWLQQGSRSDEVKRVQQYLRANGWSLAVDGIYGPQTERTVTLIQSMSGLKADGIVGPVTWAALGLNSSAVATTPATRISPPTTPAPAPIRPTDYDCDSWRSTIEKFGMPWSWARPIIYRETRCSHQIADRPSTRDLSVGAFQVNFYGRLAGMWNDAGWSFNRAVNDPVYAVAAAGALYKRCGGGGPWSPPYSCRYSSKFPSPEDMGV